MTLYGSVYLPRAKCYKCKSYSIVIDGIIQCCYVQAKQSADNYQVMVEPEEKRRCLGKKDKEEKLAEQEWRCYYCDMNLYGSVMRNGRRIRLKIEWDHFVPFDYSRNNSKENFVASCQICNVIKSDLFFETSDKARSHIAITRKNKGYL